MFNKIAWIVTFVFSLAFSQIGLAESCDHIGWLKDMVSSLKLDAAQKEKITPIIEQLKTSLKASGTQIEGVSAQLKHQLAEPTFDQSKVDDLVDQKAKLIGDMMKAKISATNQVFTVLTPKQKTEMQTMVNKLEAKMAAKYKSCHE
jgi:protein CpxP